MFAVTFENRFEWVGSGPSSRSLLEGGGKRDLPDQKSKPNFQFAEAQHADTLLQIGWIVLVLCFGSEAWPLAHCVIPTKRCTVDIETDAAIVTQAGV